MSELKEINLQRAINLLCQMYLPSFDEEEHNALYTAIVALEEKKNKYYDYDKVITKVSVDGEKYDLAMTKLNNEKIINEKLDVILDRLDKIEKKLDDNIITVPYSTTQQEKIKEYEL